MVRVVRARRGVGTHWQPSQVWVVATGVGTHWQPLKKCEPGVGSGEAKRARMGQVWEGGGGGGGGGEGGDGVGQWSGEGARERGSTF